MEWLFLRDFCVYACVYDEGMYGKREREIDDYLSLNIILFLITSFLYEIRINMRFQGFLLVRLSYHVIS